jgi:anhydro-N-acetylmuramic acid kinase
MNQQPSYYIGLMSGTSLDAIDAVLIDFNQKPLTIIKTHTSPLNDSLKKNILNIVSAKPMTIEQVGLLHSQLGYAFADTVLALLKKSKISPEKIKAIGSPGQTICHHPNASTYPFTLQAGDASIIATRTSIPTVTDFRSKDVALHGQGAPFAPIFHEQLFRTRQQDRCIINIGGIANITLLPAKKTIPVTGFDVGPGNMLLNAWIAAHQRLPLDYDGQWAEGGHYHEPLLNALLNDAYFLKPPPKSTGREYFNLPWLEHYLTHYSDLSPQNIQATLTRLTAELIAQAVKNYLPRTSTILLCGGGANNRYLVKLIKSLLKQVTVVKTNAFGIDAQFIEAALFAWLAKQRMNERKVDLCHITGASRPAILGAVYLPN